VKYCIYATVLLFACGEPCTSLFLFKFSKPNVITAINTTDHNTKSLKIISEHEHIMTDCTEQELQLTQTGSQKAKRASNINPCHCEFRKHPQKASGGKFVDAFL
jgi:hypothetical protein